MVFKNRYVETKDMNRTKCGVAESTVALSLFYILFMFFAWNNDNYGMMILWGALAFITWIEASHNIEKWEKQYEAKPIKNPEILLEFYEDKMVVKEHNYEPRELMYSEVQDIEDHSDSFILYFNFKEHDTSKFAVHIISAKELEESTLLVPKKNFEIGDAKDFKKFIKSKKQKGFVIH